MSLKVYFYTNKENENVIPEPIPAYKQLPKWFSELPNTSSSKRCPFRFLSEDKKNVDRELNTAKSCPGIFDFVTSGYIINSWSTFLFREDNSSLYVNWIDSTVDNFVTFHESWEVGNYFNEEDPYKVFVKIKSPWMIKTDPGVSVLIVHPLWNNENRFTTAAGIYHTDISAMTLPWFFKWNSKIHSGMELDGMDEKTQIIEVGTPLMYIIPFYRKKFKSEINYVDSSKIKNMEKSTFAINHGTSRIKNSIYNTITRRFGIRYR